MELEWNVLYQLIEFLINLASEIIFKQMQIFFSLKNFSRKDKCGWYWKENLMTDCNKDALLLDKDTQAPKNKSQYLNNF